MEFFALVGWLVALIAGGGAYTLFTARQRLEDELHDEHKKGERLEGAVRKATQERDTTVRRVKEQARSATRFAQEPLARDLLEVVDNFDRAVESCDPDDPVAQGVRAIHAQMLHLLKRHGVTPIDAVGLPFDPAVHEAVGAEESVEHAEDVVIRQWVPGYRLHERVLRPSRVVVAVPATQVDEAAVVHDDATVAASGAGEE